MNDKQTQRQTAVRFPDAILEEADELIAAFSRPGLQLTRADILRMAVVCGVEQLKAEAKKKR